MAYPDITQLPDAPNRGSDNSTEFSNKTDNLLTALQPFVDDVNAAGEYIQDTATEVEDNAEVASDSADAALGAANYKGDWTSSTNVLQGQSYSYNGGTWIAKRNSSNQTPAENTYWLKGIGSAGKLDTGTGLSQVPTNSVLGSSAYVDTGVDSDQIATNESSGFVAGGISSSRDNYIEDWDLMNFSLLSRGYIYFYNSDTLNMPSSITDITPTGELICFKTNVSSWGGFILRHRNALARISFSNNSFDSVSRVYDVESNATSSQISTGTSTDTVVTPSALAGSGYNPDNRYFESSNMTASVGGVMTAAHGLGETPKWAHLIAECTTAQFGFSVGDTIILPVTSNDLGNVAKAASIKVSSTTISVYLASTASLFWIQGPTNYGVLNYSGWTFRLAGGI